MTDETAARHPGIIRVDDASGNVIYHYLADATWDGFDSLIKYLRKHWSALVWQEGDEIYSRTWLLRVGCEDVEIRFDGYGIELQSISAPSAPTSLEKVYQDLKARFEG